MLLLGSASFFTIAEFFRNDFNIAEPKKKWQPPTSLTISNAVANCRIKDNPNAEKKAWTSKPGNPNRS